MTVYKMIEVVGTSGTSIDDAIRGAIERASSSLDDLQWFEVKEIRGRINDANDAEFQVKLDLGFIVHAPDDIEVRKATRRGKTPTTRQTRSAAAQLIARKGGRKQGGIARDFREQGSK